MSVILSETFPGGATEAAWTAQFVPGSVSLPFKRIGCGGVKYAWTNEQIVDNAYGSPLFAGLYKVFPGSPMAVGSIRTRIALNAGGSIPPGRENIVAFAVGNGWEPAPGLDPPTGPGSPGAKWGPSPGEVNPRGPEVQLYGSDGHVSVQNQWIGFPLGGIVSAPGVIPTDGSYFGLQFVFEFGTLGLGTPCPAVGGSFSIYVDNVLILSSSGLNLFGVLGAGFLYECGWRNVGFNVGCLSYTHSGYHNTAAIDTIEVDDSDAVIDWTGCGAPLIPDTCLGQPQRTNPEDDKKGCCAVRSRPPVSSHVGHQPRPLDVLASDWVPVCEGGGDFLEATEPTPSESWN